MCFLNIVTITQKGGVTGVFFLPRSAGFLMIFRFAVFRIFLVTQVLRSSCLLVIAFTLWVGKYSNFFSLHNNLQQEITAKIFNNILSYFIKLPADFCIPQLLSLPFLLPSPFQFWTCYYYKKVEKTRQWIIFKSSGCNFKICNLCNLHLHGWKKVLPS